MVLMDLGPNERLVLLPIQGRDWICAGCGRTEKWHERRDVSGVIAVNSTVQRPVTRVGHLDQKGQLLYHVRCVPKEWWKADPDAKDGFGQQLLSEAWQTAMDLEFVPHHTEPWPGFPSFRARPRSRRLKHRRDSD